ncbi:protein NO VEIN domain-containing protein [Micromonospora echinaurantiaca]|uniref:protein NO VEIN domain-containing protein n=1 Tax=Micromonospora echinaurantiaca TaxID=47857 RepID=UPI0034401AE1
MTGYTPLPAPVDQTAFQQAEAALRQIKQKLDETYQGPLYFPFAFYANRPVRVMQAYLVKLPAAILEAVPELADVPRFRPSRLVRSTPRPASGAVQKAEARSGSGYIADPVLRQALERHAVDRAAALYEGYEIEQIGKPYDLLAVKGTEELHIEVKGSSGTADTVELTKNEVRHAYDAETHLVVVDQIRWSRLPNGEIFTDGGRVRRWTTWTPHDEDLEVTRYRYRLPTRAELPGAAGDVSDRP